MVWKTEIVLANHARGMCFDSDKVHKMLVRAAERSRADWEAAYYPEIVSLSR